MKRGRGGRRDFEDSRGPRRFNDRQGFRDNVSRGSGFRGRSNGFRRSDRDDRRGGFRGETRQFRGSRGGDRGGRRGRFQNNRDFNNKRGDPKRNEERLNKDLDKYFQKSQDHAKSRLDTELEAYKGQEQNTEN